MNKETFNMIKEYEKEIFNLYKRLEEKGFSDDEAAEIVGDLDFLGDKFLNIEFGHPLFERMDSVEPTFITEDYENIPKYLKLYIIREYEDEMVLCMSTAEEVYLVPKNLLDNPNAEWLDQSSKKDSKQ